MRDDLAAARALDPEVAVFKIDPQAALLELRRLEMVEP